MSVLTVFTWCTRHSCSTGGTVIYGHVSGICKSECISDHIAFSVLDFSHFLNIIIGFECLYGLLKRCYVAVELLDLIRKNLMRLPRRELYNCLAVSKCQFHPLIVIFYLTEYRVSVST